MNQCGDQPYDVGQIPYPFKLPFQGPSFTDSFYAQGMVDWMATILDQMVVSLARQQAQQEAIDNLVYQLLPQSGAAGVAAAAPVAHERGLWPSP